MAKSKEWSKKLREEFPSQSRNRIQKNSEGTKSKKEQDTVGSIIHKFKVRGTAVTLPGWGRKRKL